MYFVVVRRLTLGRGNAWTWAGSCRVNLVKFSDAKAVRRFERTAFSIARKEPENHCERCALVAPGCAMADFPASASTRTPGRDVSRPVRTRKAHTLRFRVSCPWHHLAASHGITLVEPTLKATPTWPMPCPMPCQLPCRCQCQAQPMRSSMTMSMSNRLRSCPPRCRQGLPSKHPHTSWP